MSQSIRSVLSHDLAIDVEPSMVATPLRRPSTSHPLPPSPTPTEIIPDIELAEITAEDCMVALLTEGIKVRDFIYEPVPNSCKAPEVFDHPSPPLIAADWHMQNTQRNNGPQSGKALFQPIKHSGCWVSEAEVAMPPMCVHKHEFRALTRYSERSEEQYPTGHSEVEELKLKHRRQDHGTS
ncbi:hypothetical protein BJV78DRAFT_1158653 [Lactifluus subvellereus]|nr:hypothetical protein BJV78DRAFT_1158653 [Lactifluus subvellereus]